MQSAELNWHSPKHGRQSNSLRLQERKQIECDYLSVKSNKPYGCRTISGTGWAVGEHIRWLVSIVE